MRKMKDSSIQWIGQISDDWKLSSVKYGVSKVGSGKTPYGRAETYSTSGILFLRSQNIYNTDLVLDNPTYITEDVDEEMKNSPFLMFPVSKQQEIVDYLDTKCTEIDNLIAPKEQFLKEIETYKKSLIYEYVTDKKEVSAC